MDIHKGLGNANKIMNRLLYAGFEHFGLRISNINGGSLRNAIPRESFATILIDTASKELFLFEIDALIESIKGEFKNYRTQPFHRDNGNRNSQQSNGVRCPRESY